MLGYTRVSTASQQDSGAGLGAQRAAIEDECRRREWHLVELIEDAGSGRDLHRPGLERALEMCRSGEADGIVVSKLDRLSRSVVDFGGLLEDAKRHDFTLIALDFGLDLSTPGGELVANVLVSVAQWERRVIGMRTREGLAEKRRQGVKLGRRYSIGEETAKRIVELRRDGFTHRGIADVLNRAGVPTSRGGARWHGASVRRVLLRSGDAPSQRVASGAATVTSSGPPGRAPEGQSGEGRPSAMVTATGRRQSGARR
jgi:DNA invertase Pin-like site-specific DNA recombinase